ncbi:MAG: NADH-quinone oxidoreductase subunit N [Anaerolineae bacterium]|nr:NADH-quinone oxidoreductase subunit N [Anaerolineae bacterium]
MTLTDLIALLPLLVLALAALIVMLAIAFYRRHGLAFGLAVAGLGLSFASLLIVAPLLPRRVSSLVIVDAYGLFYLGLILAAGLAVALLAYGYLRQHPDQPEEFYLLLLLATLGAAVLVISDHFVSFFLGLEILSVSLYTLIAYVRANPFNLEAGFKYLILAGASSAFLLFGMALIYAALGTMEFSRMAEFEPSENILLLTGLAMTVIGIGFKLAVVPFHMWTPDVYEGAPAPVTALIATVSKGAMLALLLRYFTAVNGYAYDSVVLVFTVIAVASMLGGSLLALLQTNVKRILAYSSIAHLGYMLVAFLAGGALAVSAITYYLAAYFVTTLSAFGVVTVLSGPEREADTLADYRALFWRRPGLAGLFTAALLSLAGMPLTAGFVGKFYVVAAGINAAQWVLVGSLVASSAISIFFYLRIVVALYSAPAEGEPLPLAASLTLAGGTALSLLALLLFWLGIYPAPFIEAIQTMVASIG